MSDDFSMTDCADGNRTLYDTIEHCCKEYCEDFLNYDEKVCCVETNCSTSYPDLCKIFYSLKPAIEPSTSATSSTWSSTTIQDNNTAFDETTSDVSSLQSTTSPATEKDIYLADPTTTKIYHKPGSDVKPFFDNTTVICLVVVISIICLIAVVYGFVKLILLFRKRYRIYVQDVEMSSICDTNMVGRGRPNSIHDRTSRQETEQQLISVDPNAPAKMHRPRAIRGNLTQFDDTLTFNELNMNDIKDLTRLGSGHFGVVHRGVLHGDHLPTSGITVALKEICEVENDDTSDEPVALYCLQLELKALQLVGHHPNVIKLIGVISQPIFLLVMELCEFGDLEKYLKEKNRLNKVFFGEISNEVQLSYVLEHQILTLSALVMYALQIANGLAFLSQYKLIHRDLALRNILLKEDHIVKITDFGLVVRGDEYVPKYRKELPISLLPPESFFDESQTVTQASDVWSFGVTLWQIFNLGKNPSELVRVKQYIAGLPLGKRYPRPQFASDQIYNLMTHCWSFSPTDRPTFDACRSILHNILCENAPDLLEYILSKL